MKRLTLITLLLALTLTSCRFSPRAAAPLPSTPEAASPSPSVPASDASATSAPVAHSLNPVLDLRYSDEPVEDPRQLSLDIYPTSQPNAPVVIFIHGGGWMRGNKSNVDFKPRAFNLKGLIFVSISYRLVPSVDISTQMGDAAASVAWVKGNIAEYGGDPNRIFLMGHSAGAHIVSLLATDATYLEAEGVSLTDIRGVISLDTQAYDINTLLENAPERTSRTYRSVFGDDPQNWKKFSPATYVETGQSIPPFFLVYSGQSSGRRELCELFAQALEEVGISATIQPAAGKSHEEVNADFGAPGEPMSDAAFLWLIEILAGL